MNGSSDTTKMFCTACGAENNAANSFCLSCGERLAKDVSPASDMTVAVTPPPAADNVTVAVAPPPPTAPPNAAWYAENGTNPYTNTGQSSPGSQPPYQAPPPVVVASVQPQQKGMAIASMVCGIVSLVCCYGGFLVGIAGLITGILSLTKKQDGRPMAIAGVILSAIGFLLWGIITIAFIYAIIEGSSVFYDSFWNEMDNYF